MLIKLSRNFQIIFSNFLFSFQKLRTSFYRFKITSAYNSSKRIIKIHHFYSLVEGFFQNTNNLIHESFNLYTLNFARNMCCPHHIDSHDHTTYMNPKCSNPSIIIFHFVENKKGTDFILTLWQNIFTCIHSEKYSSKFNSIFDISFLSFFLYTIVFYEETRVILRLFNNSISFLHISV